MSEREIHRGMRVMTGAGPGTIVRIFDNEVHVQPDRYRSLTCVCRPEDITGPLTQEQLESWEAAQKRQPRRAMET